MDVKEYQAHIRVLEEKIESLEDENAQLRTISENSTDIISIHSADGTFLYVSPSCFSLLGYGPNEILGFTPYDFLYPDDEEYFKSVHTKILSNKNINTWSYQLRKKNGKYIWVETTSKYIEEKEPEGKFEIIAVTREITSRKIAELTLAIRESELKEKEELFRTLIQNISDIIVVADQEGILTYASPSAEKILGYLPGDIILKSATRFIHPDDVSRVKGEFNAISSLNNQIARMEFRVRHASGNWLYIEVIGNNLVSIPSIGGIVFTARDITGRKQQEQLLEKYQQKLEYLVKERNEELAQINEELAVTNEELVATNDELFHTVVKLNQTNKGFTEEIEKRKSK